MNAPPDFFIAGSVPPDFDSGAASLKPRLTVVPLATTHNARLGMMIEATLIGSEDPESAISDVHKLLMDKGDDPATVLNVVPDQTDGLFVIRFWEGGNTDLMLDIVAPGEFEYDTIEAASRDAAAHHVQAGGPPDGWSVWTDGEWCWFYAMAFDVEGDNRLQTRAVAVVNENVGSFLAELISDIDQWLMS